MRKIFIAVWLLLGVLSVAALLPSVAPTPAVASSETIAVGEPMGPGTVYLFGRDTCGFCKAEKEFLTEAKIPYTYLNIVEDEAAKALYDQVTE
nr:hypothetical protein [Candidatus Paceibacterota bacterium]